ncbi:Transcription factor TFIIIB component B [Puccinia graminis f. sp. tritici]|uniref:Transcription factor TFIIIB component B n=1 Tax=Puccinia graminis f. sp. tritici TaxID=56615 RepID=A0A5B0QB03_PUCGR|nr:Transcription factor TFIIIB component B [Puccinia graminis f. sp. tritici]
MSRVVKGGRLFKPVAKPNTAGSRKTTTEPPTEQTQQLGPQLPTPPSTSKTTDYPPVNKPPATDNLPLFRPETSPTPSLSEHAQAPQPTCSSSTSTSAEAEAAKAATTSSSIAISHTPDKQLSAAEKMKLKAKAAKAARAAEKLRNPSAFRRSTSVMTDTSTISTHRNSSSNRAISPPITTTQASLKTFDDISVPDLQNSTQHTSQPSPQKAWSPPIDPLLDIAAFIDGTATTTLTDQPFRHPDIPVPDIPSSSHHHHHPSPSPSGPSPTLSDHQSQPTNTQKQPTPRASQTKSKPPIKKQRAKVVRAESNDPNEEEDISPRLKRKQHLEELRKNKKKKKPNDERGNSQAPSQNQDDNDDDDDGTHAQMDKINGKVSARFKRRLEKTCKKPAKKTKRTPQPKNKKKSNLDQEGVDENEGPEGEGEEEGEESDGPLDPTKVSMADLTRPERAKGQSSEVLEKRLQLIIERRDREKNERLMARLEAKKQARLVLFNRAQSVKARRKSLSDRLDTDLQNDDHPDRMSTGSSPLQEASETTPDQQQQEEEEQQQQQQDEDPNESRKRKIMEEYGLEDLDSDDDLADFEEVEYSEFKTSAKKSSQPSKSTTTTSVDQANQQDPQDQEEQEEEVVEEEFNVDDFVPQAAHFAPQLRVVNGQIILDQDSLEVDRRDQTPQLDEMEVVEESDSTRLVNSNTWSKAVRGERWSVDETNLFYDAVRLFGSDFEMISQLFPGRTRRQIRLKWNKEEKKSPEEITRALLGGPKRDSSTSSPSSVVLPEELSPISEEEEGLGESVEDLVIPSQLNGFSEYARIVGIDTSGPIPADPMDKWREKERLEFEENRRISAESSSTNKAKKNRLESPGNLDIDDDDDAELVEENFGGWGELDDL